MNRCGWLAIRNPSKGAITVMGWFCLLWTILFAVSVSCQNLTTVPPQDDDACMRNEVTFVCTISGSLTLTELVLAWRSTEYIGQGDPLRFTSVSENMPGMNISSMINGNVTAILISNTMIGRVPELVSELHIVGASQTSVITCSSESNQTSVTTTFVSSAYPGRPQIGEARERSAGSCDFQVTWDPPTNIDTFDIGRYIIYVPSRNMMNDSSSATIGLIIPNCRVGNNSIQVAAVNRFGCVGPNSSHIQLSLLEIPPDGSSGELVTRVAGGIIGGVCAFFIVIAVVCLVIWCTERVTCRRKRKRTKDKFGSHLGLLYETLKRNKPSSMKEAVRDLLDVMPRNKISSNGIEDFHWRKKCCNAEAVRDLLGVISGRKISSNGIKEALKSALKTRITSARGIRFAVRRLKTMIPGLMLTFDAELGELAPSITTDNLIALKDTDNHKKPRNDLIRLVDQASPKKVKGHLQQLFEALQNYQAENELQEDFDKLEEVFVSCEMPPTEIKNILLEAIYQLQGRNRTATLSSRSVPTGTKVAPLSKGDSREAAAVTGKVKDTGV